MSSRFVRVAETGRKTFDLIVDGVVTQACEGDTLMVATTSATSVDASMPSEA